VNPFRLTRQSLWADSSQNVFSLLIPAPLTGRQLSVGVRQTYFFLVIAFVLKILYHLKALKSRAIFSFSGACGLFTRQEMCGIIFDKVKTYLEELRYE
jgi:hypothetical protein